MVQLTLEAYAVVSLIGTIAFLSWGSQRARRMLGD